MDYEKALSFIYSRKKIAKSSSLERIGALLSALSEPQKKLRFIHVLGTNGKGSVSAMAASCLTAAGYRTGKFTSPFVVNFRERIQVDSEYISESDFCRLTEKVREKSEQLPENLQPTFFEFILAVSLLYFCEQKCDLVVLEAGIGGQSDSTNIIPAPLVSIFTSVSLDHTALLGDTAEKIAENKAGAIKNGSVVISFPGENGGFDFVPQKESVCKILRRKSAEENCKIVFPDMKKLCVLEESMTKTVLKYEALTFSLKLPGEHQFANAACALECMKALRSLGWSIPDAALQKGMESAFLPARTEIVKKEPLVLIDGGHNEGAAKTLSKFIDRFLIGKSITLLAAFMKDKDYKTAIKILAPKCKNIVFTLCDEHRGESPRVLARCAENYCKNVFFEDDIDAALKKGEALLEPDSALIIAGSFYLASAVRKNFIR